MQDCAIPENRIDEYMGRLKKEAYEKKLPFKGVFELTPRCNFNCNMCYVHLKKDEIPAQGRELDAGEWIRLAKEAQKAGTIDLTLTGGEPFVRPDFREIYEAAHDMGFLIQIFSNGSLIDEQTVEWLGARPPKAVRFTLYGASDGTYEKVCGVPDGFSRVERSVELLKKAGVPLYLGATITKDNVHETEQIFRFAAKKRLPLIHTSNLVNPVRGASARAKEHQLERRLPPREVVEQIRTRNPNRFPRKPCRDFLQVCSNYRCGYWITWSGNLQLCTFLTEPSVPARPGAFMESWTELLAELEKLRQPEACASCQYERYCERCPGVLYAEAGGNGKISPEYCRQAEYNYLLYGIPLEELP